MRGEIVVGARGKRELRRRGTFEGWRLETRVKAGRSRAVVGWL